MDGRFEVPEGASPIEDASGLIPLGIFNYADLSAAEAENILQAMNKHLRRRKNLTQAWLTEEYIRKVHRDMFGGVWKWAGCYRKSEYNIGVAPHRVREEIAKLCGDAQYWVGLPKENSMTVLERGVRIHHRLAWIHPFPNGNGRHARLMADIYVHSYGHPLPMWPVSDISRTSQARAGYLAALRKADAGNFAPLVEYTVQHLQKAR